MAEEGLIQGVNGLLSDLKVEEAVSPRLVDFATYIKEYEGYYANTVSVRNNNPGNLRSSPYMSGQRDGFAYFKTYDDGWNALLWQLQISVDGRSGVYNPEMTLYEFFETYAPSSDSNAPRLYAESVAKKLGVSPETKIKFFK